MILSYSQISSLLRCGRAYEFSYVKHSPLILNPNLIYGRCLDRAVAYGFTRKLNNLPVSEAELIEMVQVFFEEETREKLTYSKAGEPQLEVKAIDWQGEEPDDIRARLKELIALYYREMWDKVEPVSVQERWERKVGGVLLVGYTDLIVKGPAVVDLKYSRRKMSETQVDNDIQSVAYSVLSGIDKFMFHQILDLKEPKVAVYGKQVEEHQKKWFENLVGYAARLIEEKIFVPNPFNFFCSMQDCSWWAECRLGI
jgi:hypothetical protein